MTKRKSNFLVSDVKRAISAVTGTGLTVFGVTIASDGSIRVETAANITPHDGRGVSPFEQWKSRRESGSDN